MDVEITGFVAGIFTTLSSLPQIIKILKSRSAKDVSAHMFIISFFGNALWLLYGWQKNSMSLMIANSISCCLLASVVALKLRFSYEE